jgi:hypothetical protein
LETYNVTGQYKYILSPGVKGQFKTTMKDTGSGIPILDKNEIDGYGVLSTNSVFSGGGFVGQWQDIVIAQFGGFSFKIDDLTRARNDETVITVNCFFDYAPRWIKTVGVTTVGPVIPFSV